MTENQQRRYITQYLRARIEGKGERRNEALRAVLDLSMPHLDDEAVADLACGIPELPASLYGKWIDMFADRLLETVPPEQIADLCRGAPESDASLLLVYVMFMESARMEKVVAEDLKGLDAGHDPETLRAWLRACASGSVRQ
jgi:hypothetical protein